MNLKLRDYAGLALIVALWAYASVVQQKPVSVEPQPIRLVVVENAKAGTPATDAAILAVQNYATTSQGGRFKKLGVESVDKDDKIPAGYERFIAEYKASGLASPRLSIVSQATGKDLWAGAIPDSVAAVTLARKYGG